MFNSELEAFESIINKHNEEHSYSQWNKNVNSDGETVFEKQVNCYRISFAFDRGGNYLADRSSQAIIS